MRQRIGRFLEKWGHYLLAALCAAVILLSGLWTRSIRVREGQGTEALHGTDQRLAFVTAPPGALFSPVRPCKGEVVRGYSDAPVYFPAVGLWHTHPAVDYAAEDGDEVFALGDGTVTEVSPYLRIDHGNGYVSEYRGLRETSLRPGQHVRAGQSVGKAGAAVPFEGPGHVCVKLTQAGNPLDFAGI